jgi:hypothetical protein
MIEILWTGSVPGQDGVAALVVGDGPLLLLGEPPRGPLVSGDHPVDCLFDLGPADGVEAAAAGQESGLVEHAGQVGPGEAGRLRGDVVEVDQRVQALASDVHLQDRPAPGPVRPVDHDLAVEAPPS